MLKSEGHRGDVSAWQAIKMLVHNNFKLWQKGKKFKGRPYIKYNRQKGQLVFLEIEEFFNDEDATEWIKDEKEGAAGEEVPAITPGTKEKDTGKGEKPKPKISPEKKKCNQAIQGTIKMNKTILEAREQSNKIKELVETDAGWVFFKDHPDLLAGLKKADQELKSETDSQWWHNCGLLEHKEFMTYTKSLTAKQILKMATLKKVEAKAAEVKREVAMIRDHKALRDTRAAP